MLLVDVIQPHADAAFSWARDFPVWLAAIGTIAVAVVAVWGEWLRSLLFDRLRIAPANLRGSKVPLSVAGTVVGEGVFYHLKVVRPGSKPARDCRVVLLAIEKRAPDGQFRLVAPTVPLQFVWTPAEHMPQTVTVLGEQEFDFVSLQKQNGALRCKPELYSYTNGFEGFVGPNEAVRFWLQARSADAFSPPQCFEVDWDGEWTTDLDQLKGHLVVKVGPRGRCPGR